MTPAETVRRPPTYDRVDPPLPRRRFRKFSIIALTLVCAAISIQRTAGNVFAKRSPELALRIAPFNAAALAISADRLIATDPIGKASAGAQLAERSLRTQALGASAVRILGYGAEVGRHPARAEALIKLSQRVSRRDLGAQLWLIEQAVGTGDVLEALRHYDIALRTTDKTAQLLYPILTSALDEQAVRTAFRPYVRARPFWMEDFLAHAIALSQHPDRIAALLLGAPTFFADARNRELSARLTERLLAGGWIDAGKRVYLATAGRSPARLVSPALDPRDGTQQDATLGWRMTSTPAAQATLDAGRGSATAVLHVEVSGDGSGRVAEKTLFLPAGSYRLSARVAPTRPESAGALRWRLDCAAADQRNEVWTRNGGAGDVVVPFVIASGCTMQVLSIDALGEGGSQGAGMDVTGIAIHRD